MTRVNKKLKRLSVANRRLKVIHSTLTMFLEFKKRNKQYANLYVSSKCIKIRYSSKWNNSLKFYYCWNQSKKNT